MKKQALFFFTAALLLVCGVSGAQTIGFSSSALDSVTYGTFNNVFDAAQTIDEADTDIAFSRIGKDYFFGGVMANPNFANPDASAARPTFGYYRSGERPWSLFGQVDYTGAGAQTVTLDDGAGTTRKPNYSAFKNFGTDLQFLINLGSFSTGLRLKLQFIDNKTVDNTHNVVVTNPDGTVDNYLENNFTSKVSFAIPFYMQTGDLKHYGEFMMNFSNVDKSLDTIVSGVKVKLSAWSGTVVPAAYYKLSMPFGPNNNQASFFGLLAVPVAYSEPKTDTHPGVNLTLGSKYKMYFSTLNDWLKFRMTPQVQYSLAYAPGTSAVSVLANKVDLSLAAAFDFRPESWIIGFMLGSDAHITYTNTASKTTAVSTIETVSNQWNTEIDFALGVYIPLPNDYRLDVLFSPVTNITQFGQLTVQLIVPIN